MLCFSSTCPIYVMKALSHLEKLLNIIALSCIEILLELDQNWFYLVTDFPPWCQLPGPAGIKAQPRQWW